MKVTIDEIRIKFLPEMFGGEGNYADISVNEFAKSICTDSREAEKGSVFVAIKGENTDGHIYIDKAVALGAVAVICEYIPENAPSHCLYIVTENSEKALMKGADSYRKNFEGFRSCAVTGSVGKTTAKEAVYCALSSALDVYKTDGNFNSTIGMPTALLGMPKETKNAVYEMGMSGLSEIHAMSITLRPDVAIITNVGHSHLEYLGTRENILKAKLEITDGLSTEGTLIINGDDIMLRTVDYSKYPFRTVRCSVHDDSAEYFADNIRFGDGKMIFDLKTLGSTLENVTIPGTGNHLVLSALFALAAADAFDVDLKVASAGLSSFQNAAMRQNVIKVGDITVIEDCYNAAPESMRSAIETLAKLGEEGKRTFALLGEMRELGSDTRRLHFEVGKLCAEKKIDCLVALGQRGEDIVTGAVSEGFRRADTYLYINPDEYERVARLLLELMSPGDVLLVKASRAIRAERVIEALRAMIETNT